MSAEVDVRRLRADDLRYLLAVANTGRLTAAADALGVDHTTVSRRIKVLEKVLKVRVLERGADGWELTEVGRAVAEPARPIQEAVERAALAASGASDDAGAGNFRITAPDGFGTLFVVPALERLRERHPGLNIELITATRNLILHQSGFDLAIAVGRPATGRLFAEKLADYSLHLFASTAYLERHGVPASVEDLRRHTVVFYVDSLLQVGDLDLTQYLPGSSPASPRRTSSRSSRRCASEPGSASCRRSWPCVRRSYSASTSGSRPCGSPSRWQRDVTARHARRCVRCARFSTRRYSSGAASWTDSP